MNFAFDESQEELRSAARAFLAEHSTGEQVRAAMTSELGYDAEVWKRIGVELGWPALLVPEEDGGLGLGFVELVALMEVMGEALLCSPFFATVCLGANALCEAGSPAQKGEHLPPLAEGRLRATLAVPGHGGRWAAEGVALELVRRGDELRLSGIARYVPDGHLAELLVVAARRPGTRGEEGVSLVILPGGAEGLERAPLPTMDQTRRLAELRLSDVCLPASALLGEEGEAAPTLRRILDRAGVALAAEQVGAAQRCLDLSVAYAKERVQFGRPIGSFQAIKHKCADMMVAVESARSAAYYAGCVADGGDEELGPVASLAQVAASEAFYRCAAEAIQIHGGVGFTWEYDPHLYFKRARASRELLGDPIWHRERVARHILGDRAS